MTSLKVLRSIPIARIRRFEIRKIPRIGASVLIIGRLKKRDMGKIVSIAAELCILAGVCAIGGVLVVASPAIFIIDSIVNKRNKKWTR